MTLNNFCTLSWCRIRKNARFEYLYLFTLETAPFNDNPVISSNDRQKTGIYQLSADRCVGDRYSDLICLLQQSQAIHYCNQSLLVIVSDLNIFVFSITVVDIILRSAVVRL